MTEFPAREDASLAPAAGVHDFLSPDSVARRRLADRLIGTFSSFGYERVITPLFEHASVIERGLAQSTRQNMIRFVEPDTGEIAVLRPDITPQIARVIATRLRDRPGPFRLCYEGAVIRRGRDPLEGPRQVDQAGVECVGISDVSADTEVINVVLQACRHAGVAEPRVELGQVKVARRLLAEVPKAAHDDILKALAHKDQADLEQRLKHAGVSRGARAHLHALPELYGGIDVIARARKRFRNLPRVVAALDELDALRSELAERGVDKSSILVDLGELWGREYYTGLCFTFLAEGPGHPLGAGGRYDQLLGRFAMPSPACGAALDLGYLEEAAPPESRASKSRRVVVSGPNRRVIATSLRDRGLQVAEISRNPRDAAEFGRSWGFDARIVASSRSLSAERLGEDIKDSKPQRFPFEDSEALVAWLHAGRTD